AARAVGAHEMIARLPGGYLHEVAERGRNLSAAQEPSGPGRTGVPRTAGPRPRPAGRAARGRGGQSQSG
ncbi:hypothetical protein AB0N19_35940, partial [Streptomyces sp. NPDC051132]|uniref:hypothetical protein n=1 Tax=Streptomyces sp. NPDC051132 TaxID=3155667 RepID=UPI00342B27CE